MWSISIEPNTTHLLVKGKLNQQTTAESDKMFWAAVWMSKVEPLLTLYTSTSLAVREVEWGNEQTHTFTLYTIPVQVVCDYPGHKVLSCSRPAMKGQSQWFVGLRIFDESLNGFQNHRLDQVLPMKFHL